MATTNMAKYQISPQDALDNDADCAVCGYPVSENYERGGRKRLEVTAEDVAVVTVEVGAQHFMALAFHAGKRGFYRCIGSYTSVGVQVGKAAGQINDDGEEI